MFEPLQSVLTFTLSALATEVVVAPVVPIALSDTRVKAVLSAGFCALCVQYSPNIGRSPATSVAPTAPCDE